MKKISILFFILFFNICSNSESGVISISENTTTTKIINEEDYPLVLANCLNEEKGYQIVTPFDLEDLKTTINQLSQSKEDQLELGEAIDFCIDKYNLWSDRSTLNPEELAKLYDENISLARCLREKGLDVPDPTQDQPKIDLSNLVQSKDEIITLLDECELDEKTNKK
tara:strand:+ start:1918 stop:2421 length:504 start_codon:yes stop_codon:yes gene_type:complete